MASSVVGSRYAYVSYSRTDWAVLEQLYARRSPTTKLSQHLVVGSVPRPDGTADAGYTPAVAHRDLPTPHRPQDQALTASEEAIASAENSPRPTMLPTCPTSPCR